MLPDSLSCSSFVFKIQVTSSSSTHYHSSFLYIKYFFLHFSIGEKEFSVPLKPQFSHFHKLHCMLFKPLKPHPWRGAPPLTNQTVLKKKTNSFRIQNTLFGKFARDYLRHLQKKKKSRITFKSFEHHKTIFYTTDWLTPHGIYLLLILSQKLFLKIALQESKH